MLLCRMHAFFVRQDLPNEGDGRNYSFLPLCLRCMTRHLNDFSTLQRGEQAGKFTYCAVGEGT